MKKNKTNSCSITLRFLIYELSDTEQMIKGGREVYLSAAIGLLWIILLRKAVEARKKKRRKKNKT